MGFVRQILASADRAESSLCPIALKPGARQPKSAYSRLSAALPPAVPGHLDNKEAPVKVKSLSRTIVVQFAVILLPMIAVVLYQVSAESRRAATLVHAMAMHEHASLARERYAVFVNGAADSVDTGRLSPAALAAHAQAGTEVDWLIANMAADGAKLEPLKRELGQAQARLERDLSLPALLQLRQPIAKVRAELERLYDDHERQVDATVQYAIRDADRTRQIVIGLSFVLGIVTVVFILRMIRNLSQPLRLAVSMANRIASGRKFDGFQVDPKHDIGNLLGSLQRMHTSLRGFEDDVERQRIGLQNKIRQLAHSEQSLGQAQRTARLGSWEWDAVSQTLTWSDEMHRILGFAPGAQAPNLRSFLRAIPLGERRTVTAEMAALDQREAGGGVEHHLRRPDGERRVVHHQMAAERDAGGRILRHFGTVQDVTERRAAEEKMRQLAMFDGLTGLANRQSFNEHLNNAVARSKRHGTGLATLFIDLDRFKRINDTLGHAVGDAVLRQAAQRLQGCVRETDAVASGVSDPSSVVARLGGDEFIVLLRDLLAPRDAMLVANRMIHALSSPFLVDGHELVVTASIGIAMHPADGAGSEDIVKAADAAMYAAKKLGRNTFQFFTPEMNTLALEKLTLETELRHAIDLQQFVLHYQPKVHFSSGRVAGVEALVRWQHPERGLIPPGEFIALAEELGLIVAIGDWVLEASCRQAAQWKRDGLGEVSIAINLASPSFRKPHLVDELRALIERYELRPAQLQIEATETMLMESAGATLKTLEDLHALGVKLSIDDFGTGYSSLSYLRRFPVDQLKIDRSFVSEMTHNTVDAAIVAAIISLGLNMKREIVAEGVETMQQARLLHRQGCELMQGFVFSRPLPAAAMTALLQADDPFDLLWDRTSRSAVL